MQSGSMQSGAMLSGSMLRREQPRKANSPCNRVRQTGFMKHAKKKPVLSSNQLSPTRIGWSAALVSTGLVFSILSMGIYAGGVCSTALLQEELRNQINSDEQALAALQDQRFAPLFVEHKSTIRDWRSAIDLITKNRDEQAVKLLSGKALSGSNQAKQLKSLLKGKLELQEATKTGSTKAVELEKEATFARDSFRLLSSELSAVLTNPRETETATTKDRLGSGDSANNLNTKLYSTGVLQGLPVLDGVEDGITEASELEALFPQLHGLNKTQTEKLQERLNSVRKRALESLSLIEVSAQKIEEHTQLLKNYGEESKSLQSQLSQSIKSAVLAFGAVKVDPSKQAFYERFRKLLSDLSLSDLPPLASESSQTAAS